MSGLRGHDVATGMRAIEDNISGETGMDSPALDRVIATLLDLDYPGLDAVLLDESKRVLKMLGPSGWYAEHGFKATPKNIAALAFVQGVTFAVAARRAHDAAT